MGTMGKKYLEGRLFIWEGPDAGKGRYKHAGKYDEEMGNSMTM